MFSNSPRTKSMFPLLHLLNCVITVCNYSHFTLQYDANCAVFCIKSHAILTLIATPLTTRHEKGKATTDFPRHKDNTF